MAGPLKAPDPSGRTGNVNEVIYVKDGHYEQLISLRDDTATASDVAQGKTFHLADGSQAVGTASSGMSLPYDIKNFRYYIPSINQYISDGRTSNYTGDWVGSLTVYIGSNKTSYFPSLDLEVGQQITLTRPITNSSGGRYVIGSGQHTSSTTSWQYIKSRVYNTHNYYCTDANLLRVYNNSTIDNTARAVVYLVDSDTGIILKKAGPSTQVDIDISDINNRMFMLAATPYDEVNIGSNGAKLRIYNQTN